MDKLRYLKLLRKQYEDIQKASSEIINLKAILNLPKGTEVFLSDLHGEDEAFLHLLKNGSGVIKRKIEELFGATLTKKDKRDLATLIYYPKEVIDEKVEMEINDDWAEVSLNRLIAVCREVSSKYTRSKVRKVLPKGYSYILEELLHEQENDENKYRYYDQIIKSIIEMGQVEPFIIALSEIIQHLAIDHLHIIGDIFDRGPGAYRIMEKLKDYHSIDLQWGNHDILWMGASAGSMPCIANVVRVSARYGNLDTLEEDYGINLVPLAKYAMENYKEFEELFRPNTNRKLSSDEIKMTSQIHKAITIIMFKIEKQSIDRHKEYEMENRLLLDKIDYSKNTINIDGNEYKLSCKDFPTIDKDDPYRLTNQEQEIMDKLKFSFTRNERLNRHVSFLLQKGSTYLAFNNNLLYHGCIPTNENKEFTTVILEDEKYKGRKLLDKFENMARKAYRNKKSANQKELDIFWYLWCGKNSPLFGKKDMKSFERYFIDDDKLQKEKKNPYYSYVENEEYCNKVLEDFKVDDKKGKIINGHVPVKVKKGESPIKANGRLIVIDGGLSKAYQKVTGIAGYTLIYNSHGIILAAHEPFRSSKDSVKNNTDIISKLEVVELSDKRLLVKDTDTGKKIMETIQDLKELLEAYRKGLIK